MVEHTKEFNKKFFQATIDIDLMDVEDYKCVSTAFIKFYGKSELLDNAMLYVMEQLRGIPNGCF